MPAGVTLSIGPGARVVLSADRSIVVKGALVARGTKDQPIAFTGRDAGNGAVERWGSIVFEDSSDDARFEAVEQYVSGSVLEHCTLDNATRAVVTRAASPFVHACTFTANYCISADVTDLVGGPAMAVLEGSSPRIVGCVFDGNVADGVSQGGALCVDSSNPIVKDNRFSKNRSIYGGAIAASFMASPIVGNEFADNEAGWEGGAVALVSSQPAFLDNRVTGNRTVSDGGGLHVCTTCYPHANPLVMDNTFTGNTNQLEGAAGVGAAFLRVFSWNEIHDNLKGDEPADFAWFGPLGGTDPDWSVQASIPNNWWGTADAVRTITIARPAGYVRRERDPIGRGRVTRKREHGRQGRGR